MSKSILESKKYIPKNTKKNIIFFTQNSNINEKKNAKKFFEHNKIIIINYVDLMLKLRNS